MRQQQQQFAWQTANTACLFHHLQGTSSYIVNASTWTGRPDEWSNYAFQRSSPIPLQAGELVLLEAAHCQSPSGPSLLQVSWQLAAL